MFDIDYKELRKVVGVFKKHLNNYYTFKLESGEKMIFEQINKSMIKDFELRSDKHINMVFNITFSEVFDDFGSDDFQIYKLEKLELLSE
jgi:EAL domain-containing protein (putative c-di-GMP-specific phosphodiesterase class I)